MKALTTPEQALKENLDASISDGTKRLYSTAISRWVSKGGTMPADPYKLSIYLSDLGNYVAVPTVRVHASAIAYAHKEAGYENPFDHPGIKKVLSGMARKSNHKAKQADGIDADAYEKIVAAATTPRRSRGGHMESLQDAEKRALIDVTLIGVMRDAMLRRSEAAALKWADVNKEDDGTGRIVIQRSKTDQTGEGAVRYISKPVYECLETLSWMTLNMNQTVFQMSDHQINRRIASAAKQAGLNGNYSGHSPRIGMAQDLARFGCGLPELMEAGRWKSPTMPAYYLRSVEAGKGAVAKYYGNA